LLIFAGRLQKLLQMNDADVNCFAALVSFFSNLLNKDSSFRLTW